MSSFGRNAEKTMLITEPGKIPFLPIVLFKCWTNSSEIKFDISPTSEKSIRVFSNVNDEIFSFFASLSIAVHIAARVPPMQYPVMLSLFFG